MNPTIAILGIIVISLVVGFLAGAGYEYRCWKKRGLVP